MKLIILGPPGAGKGVMSRLIAKKHRLKHVSVGDLIREEIDKKTVLGKKIKKEVNKGIMISDQDFLKILKKHMPKNNFILDGAPRVIKQKKIVDKLFTPDKVIILKLPKRIAIKRISTRYECPKCERVYGGEIKPKRRGYCDKCNVKLIKRLDDSSKKTIKHRFEVYKKQSKPVEKLYKDAIRINANTHPYKMLKAIEKKL